MTKSLNALAFAAACGMLAIALPMAAQGQGVTISGCSSPTWNANTSTLACGGGGSGPPSCTISGNANGTTGVVDNLTAICNPAATSWSWTGGNCAGGATQTCAALEAATGVKTYTVTGTNTSGSGSSPGFNVTWLSTSGPPQGCAITPAAQSLGSVGGAIVPLTVACAGGAQPLTSFTWTHSGAGCGASFTPSSTAVQTETLPANTTTGNLACQYNVTVDNGSGTPAVATAATVTVVGTSGAIDCKLGGVANKTVVQNIPWATDTGINPTGAGGLANLKAGWAYVGVINVPATATPSATVVGRADIFEYVDNAHRRWVTLSSSACAWNAPGADLATSYAFEPVIRFTVGPNTNNLYKQLTPGNTYYLNIKMVDPFSGSNQCGTGNCNLNVEFHNGL